MPTAHLTISTDDQRLRISTWTFQDGEETGATATSTTTSSCPSRAEPLPWLTPPAPFVR